MFDQRDSPVWKQGDITRGHVTSVWIYLGYVILFLSSLFISYQLYTVLGFNNILVALIALLACSIYAVISFHSVQIPFLLWLATIGGFRFLLFVSTPVLPDLTLDRIALIWLAMVFLLKAVIEKKSLRGPFRLDIVILLHGCYLYWRVWVHDMDEFHTWSLCYLIPYSAYFLSKNVMYELKWIKYALLILLILSLYYNVTSVAEKYKIYPLIWPKYVLDFTYGGSFIGRSRGPFRQAALFGTVIGMLLPVILYHLYRSRALFMRIMMYGFLGLGAIALYFTYTRGSWLAGVMALLAAGLLGYRYYAKLLAPFLIMIIIGGTFMFTGITTDRFAQERMAEAKTVKSRAITIMTLGRVWKDHPLLGVGLFNYREVRDDYLRTEDIPLVGIVKRGDTAEPVIHDIYLGPLAEDGLIGFILQMTIYFLIYKTFLKKFKLRKQGDEFASTIMPVIGGIYLGYLVGGLIIDYRFFSFVGALFYTCAGIVEGYQPNTSPRIQADMVDAKTKRDKIR